jgi:hypothetical protein
MPALSLARTQRRAGSCLRRATSGRREAPALLGAVIPAGRGAEGQGSGCDGPVPFGWRACSAHRRQREGSIRPVAGRIHTKRHAGPGEMAMYRILGSLAAACNLRFTTLELPTAITIDPGRGLLVLPRYDGDDLAGRWSETDGGALLPAALADAIAVILADLSGIDTAPVTDDPVLSAIPGLVFDHAAALTRSAGIARQLTRAGLLSGEDCVSAGQLLACRQHTPMIVNYGDFYPRNLIIWPGGRIVIVDWETWNLSSPFHAIDHPEKWPRSSTSTCGEIPAWQAAYRAALSERFAFSPAGLAKGVVIAALELAGMWLSDTDRHLAAIQASVITGTLAQTPDR